MRNIFEKFGREDQNPGGVVRPKVDFYLGHLRVKTNFILYIDNSIMTSRSNKKGTSGQIIRLYRENNRKAITLKCCMFFVVTHSQHYRVFNFDRPADKCS